MSTSIPAVELHTQRLILRPLQLSDATQTQRLFPHWEIVRLLNAIVPWPYPTNGAFTYYRDAALPAIQRGDEWHWTLRLKQSPEHHIGSIALIKSESDNRGFWLGLPWHGQGLMTEAVSAVNDFWFDVLGFPVLRAPKAVGNLASRRISEKTGMRIIATEERNFVSGTLPSEIWEMTADEWHKHRESLRERRQAWKLADHPARNVSPELRQSPHPRASAAPTPCAEYCEQDPPVHPDREE